MRGRLWFGRALVSPPGPPTITSVSGAQASTSSTASVTVNWSAPANTGGEITGYVVQVDAETPVSVSSSATQYTFSGLYFDTVNCNAYVVSVTAENTAGQGPAATATAYVPNTVTPSIYNITKVPNEGAPGVQYTVRWFGPCAWDYPVSQFEVQTRMFFNGSEEISQGAEENWEAFDVVTWYVASQQVGTATSTQQWQFRVRAKYVVGGSVQQTSGWSTPSAY